MMKKYNNHKESFNQITIKRMKTLRFNGVALLAVLMSVSFSACGGDGDDNGGNNYKSLIVGKWKLVEPYSLTTNVEYKRDGTFSYTSIEDPTLEVHGVYKIEGDVLSEMFSKENDWERSKINTLNNTTLILQGIKDNGELKKNIYTWQRE